MPRLSRLVHPPLLILLLWSLSGCHGWHRLDAPVAEALAVPPGKAVRIGLADGSVVRADSVRIGSDSLMAWRSPTRSRGGELESYSLAAVRTVEVRRIAKVRSALAVTGLLAGGALIVAIATWDLDFGQWNFWGSNP